VAAPRKYPEELRERATRLAVEARKDPEGRTGAIKRIADQLDVHPEALRGWVKQAETDEGTRPGTTSAEAARIAELEREVKELRRANTILKSASAFFAAELCATRRRGDRGVVQDHPRWAVAAA
jgi:transposase